MKPSGAVSRLPVPWLCPRCPPPFPSCVRAGTEGTQGAVSRGLEGEGSSVGGFWMPAPRRGLGGWAAVSVRKGPADVPRDMGEVAGTPSLCQESSRACLGTTGDLLQE